MIEATELSKRYEDGALALDSLDLAVGEGEIYCLLGANGAGKTTTINIFLDFIEPTGGRALVNGVDANRDPLEAKRYVGYLSENVMLYGNFTAVQNLEFFSRLGGQKELDRDGYHGILRKAGLPEEAFERKVRDFSKGMRQKLGIAIAMSKDAPALLLDEPMSGLDPKAAVELVATLAALRDSGKAILMSTHDIFRARDLADRVGFLKQGRKVLECAREELRDQSLEALYLEHLSDAAPSAAGRVAARSSTRRSA